MLLALANQPSYLIFDPPNTFESISVRSSGSPVTWLKSGVSRVDRAARGRLFAAD
ncbi:hypothetical protein BJ970_006845 [Saccharopolyspora phatthalungensis]|uniref:Uncharacterized protein n=1 Tax=Saccharopolyspora phatthalungensis TaxID=664693 RepID=A0A840QFM7_9PSEU|nr:hypothetical protein [Saccharopolyspora phatthalungensis]